MFWNFFKIHSLQRREDTWSQENKDFSQNVNA